MLLQVEHKFEIGNIVQWQGFETDKRLYGTIVEIIVFHTIDEFEISYTIGLARTSGKGFVRVEEKRLQPVINDKYYDPEYLIKLFQRIIRKKMSKLFTIMMEL